jgi:hypothetical protein
LRQSALAQQAKPQKEKSMQNDFHKFLQKTEE